LIIDRDDSKIDAGIFAFEVPRSLSDKLAKFFKRLEEKSKELRVKVFLFYF